MKSPEKSHSAVHGHKKARRPRRRRLAIALVPMLTLFIWWFFCLPANLFQKPTATVLLDRDGRLLGARIADDGQWRFPASEQLPGKFKDCILTYEDRDFYAHWGISPKALGRAIVSNAREGEVVSGASTITMQVMRMARSGKPRNIWQKFIESAWATRAEWTYSKAEILSLYASQAPFGGNVVGLEAASWRYFDKSPEQLTWSESAALAVLPNAPGLIYPGRNPASLLRKRNALLKTMADAGIIPQDDYQLALLEPLPSTPLPLPDLAYHLVADAKKKNRGKILQTSIDQSLQAEAVRILESRLSRLRANHIANGAILIADTQTGEILAYVGNGSAFKTGDGWANNLIMTPRSSGSILKPFLYAGMIDEGLITPQSLVADIPTQYAGFSPKNYDEGYTGALPADEALARSLNVPAVRMLREFGVPQFHKTLRTCGFTTIIREPSHYGLSLIIGGAEVNLWEVVQAYRYMGHSLQNSPIQKAAQTIHYLSEPEGNLEDWGLSRAAAWAAAEAMALVNRPTDQANWQVFGDSQKIAWKTGTSYGFRDAWAVGVTPKYTVGIWVGNASGEGRPGLTGLHAAAPILFDIFNILPASDWFMPPNDELQDVEVCGHSGMRISGNCGKKRMAVFPKSSLQSPPCHYCKIIHTDRDGRYQVTADCYPADQIVSRSNFELPAVEAWYFRQQNAFYQAAPPWQEGCRPDDQQRSIRLIYPQEASRVLIPRELNGTREKVVLKAAHNRKDATLFWHLNGRYLGETRGFHHIEIQEPVGKYQLRLIDETGEGFETELEIEEKG